MTRGVVVATLPVVVGFDAVVDARVVDVGAIGANDVLVVDVGTVLAAVGRAVLHAATMKAAAIVMDRSLVVLVTCVGRSHGPIRSRCRSGRKKSEEAGPQLQLIEAKHPRGVGGSTERPAAGDRCASWQFAWRRRSGTAGNG